MVLRRSTLLVVSALSVMLAGCENVPDYLVEGRLPFSRKTDTAVAQADAPPPAAQPAAPPAKPEPEARADKSQGWHLWPHKDKALATADAAPPPAPAAPPPVKAVPAPPPPPPVVADAPPPPARKRSFWPSRQPATPPMAGGYQKATDKAGVDAAVAYAMHESPLYELKGVKSAQMQVVAGRNYALCLKVRQIDHEANPFHIRLVAAKVFEGLDGHYELVSWQEVNTCG